MHDNCSTCHTLADDTISLTGIPSPRNLVIAMQAGDCVTCHGSYFPNHTIDHQARVATSSNCDSCHTAAAGTATGVPVDSNDAKVHNDCYSCHQANGTLVAPTTLAPGIASPGGDCTLCHGSGFFPNHGHHNTNNAMAMNTTGTLPDSNIGTNDPLPVKDVAQPEARQCSSCHNDNNGALASWADILVEHKSDCTKCHTSTRNTGIDPTYTDIQDIITNAASVQCLSCHYDKMAPVEHGNPHLTHFSFDGNCSPCHTDTTIILGIHNACVTCHLTSAGGLGTTKEGTSATGPDGDARLAAALSNYTTATCTTCHPAATYPQPAIHHVSANSYAANWQCSTCHTGSQVNDHSSFIGGAGNCNNCHSGTIGGSNGAPVNSSNPKIHDDCQTCHTNGGGLKTLAEVDNTKVVFMPTLNQGASTCITCHGEYVYSHKKITHSTCVDLAGNCADCHAGTRGNATTVPVGVDTKIHTGCASCHNMDGTLVTRIAAQDNGTIGGIDGGGTCATCHFNDFAASHKVVGHSAMVSDHTDCASCHDQTARNIGLSGDATGSGSFNGSANVTITVTFANSGVTAGAYPKVTVDAKGRVTAGSSLAASDIPSLDWSKIMSGKPTTLAGYGITDALASSSTIDGGTF